MSRILHRLLVFSSVLFQVAEAVLTPNTTAAAAQTPKTEIGIVESSEKEKVISAPDAGAKGGVPPSIGIVQAEKPEKVKDDATSNQKATDSTKAAGEDQKATDQQTTDTKITLSRKGNNSTSPAARLDASQALTRVTVVNTTKTVASAATVNSTLSAIAPPQLTRAHDLTFWQILVIWNSEMIHCLPIVLIAYALLSLAVHYPTIVDGIAHWYQVRTTTMQKGVLAGKNIYMGRSMPVSTGCNGELDQYSTFSTSTNHYSSSKWDSDSNQFVL